MIQDVTDPAFWRAHRFYVDTVWNDAVKANPAEYNYWRMKIKERRLVH